MRNILSLLTAVILCISLVSCAIEQQTDDNGVQNSTSKNDKEISASLGAAPEKALFVGDSELVAFKIDGYSDFSETSFEPVVINSDILSVSYKSIDKNYIYYEVTAKSEGTTEIYLESVGGSSRSEKIKFVVTNKIPEYIVGSYGETPVSIIEGYKKTICFAVLGADLAPEDVTVVVANDEIIKATYTRVSGKYIYYKLDALAAGSTTVYLETDDGIVISDRITVSVIGLGDTPEDDEVFTGFILSKNTGKFHRPMCSHVSTIKDENQKYYDCDIQELINEGYEPCSSCIPENE